MRNDETTDDKPTIRIKHYFLQRRIRLSWRTSPRLPSTGGSDAASCYPFAKKRGRLAGALLGNLAGPLGAFAGAVLNSKTATMRTNRRASAVARCFQMGTAGQDRLFWFLAIFFGGALIMVACGITLH